MDFKKIKSIPMLSRFKTSLPLVLTVCQGMLLSVCSASSLVEDTEQTKPAFKSMACVRPEGAQQTTKICAECLNAPDVSTFFRTHF